ncbi:hypothetical protein TBLA_0D03330 [Henningerozyma blattae CBS 6284]|uniref:Squalene synthase n=1 Tax=Henningerozyma blattae (strain ATCC 34711 / CBS 6284 / DSM 70876 / NBRC 10599 / NRRL Y-10934 / UCD 77-7) TaxID=1071380 RepID=I2H381_HENB6|nr:hypothetical protein TBLA_0D03330 [Tetrapisispora blattae CBS 6284]CCH60833.1 hypothetical protein TBLA_0D03330 [Tetrapisispora blattae CBS 6284]
MSKFLQLCTHPLELRAALVLKFIKKPLFKVSESSIDPNLKRCYELLNLTSRSFAAVIMELNPELRSAIAIFYLILRALDTIEDDMSIDTDEKIKLLKDFYSKLDTSDWSYKGNSKDVKDRVVLVEFPVILKEYHNLKASYQNVIKDITKKMGFGMSKYIMDENFQKNGIETIKEYDLYCHYVAGLVGDGLTRLIVLADFASEDLYLECEKNGWFESMGLFLQKTNIIRDYAEDLEDGRAFWPKEIWSRHTDQLSNFYNNKSRDPEVEKKGLECINDLVLNALVHIPDVLMYLSSVYEQSTFQFCSIPQVMAIATLALVFNNKDVLYKNVKIRKGTTLYLIQNSRSLSECVDIFQYYLRQIRKKLPVDDPNYLKINIQVAKIEQFIEEMYQDQLPKGVKPNETKVYLKAKAREVWDDKIYAQIKEEESIFNLSTAIILCIIGGVLYAKFCSTTPPAHMLLDDAISSPQVFYS